MDSGAAHTAAVENYLKVIYSLAERDGSPATTSRLAERLGVLASSASGMVRRLVELGLVEHRPYGEITLTEPGTTAALSVVRRHRLVEMYLVSELGFGWDEVHDEAEVLEHAVSDRLLERMDARLGRPRFDPHGDPIPGSDGVPAVHAQRLSTVAPGTRGRLVRVDDTDPQMLRHLSERAIGLGEALELIDRRPFDGPFVVRSGDKGRVREHDFAPALAAALWIDSSP